MFHPASRKPAPLSLSHQDFQSEFPSEGLYVEFKSGISGKELQNTAVAFSNARGGVVLIGVDDGGVVLGRAADAGTQDDIHAAMLNARDIGRYTISEVDVGGKPVTVLVSRRHDG